MAATSEDEDQTHDDKNKKKDEGDSSSSSRDKLIAMRRLDLVSQARFISNRAVVFNIWMNDTVTALASLASILTLAFVVPRSLPLLAYSAACLLGCIAGVIVYGTIIRILLNGGRKQPTYARILQMSSDQLHRYVRCLQDVKMVFHSGANERPLNKILKEAWQKHAKDINYREDDPVHEAAEREEEETTQALKTKYNFPR